MSRKLCLLLAVVALIAAACGSSDDGAEPSGSSLSGSGSADTGQADTGETDTGEVPANGAVSTLEGVRTAVIQIVATGNFAQPDGSLASFAEVEGAGSGSGFIIDPAGIAVTNNHVVTGAATLEVFVDDQEEPVNAKVLGVSECSDLAVIDLGGEGYPYLSWFGGEIQPGLEVRAAGFPLGDPEYTLTSGIVSKAEANGDTDWASVESVIEQDANIQPGNSGGPLVTADTGEVVAVNYAGGDPGTGTAQFFAISSELARPTVDQLQQGDVESLGINGVAVADPESGIQGIWVSSVETDSPAGALGLEGGDIVERIEGLTVGADGTMKDYCDILRSHDPSEKLAVQVLRFEENARLEGEFNGDELAAVESLVSDVVEQGGLATEGTEYAEFVQVEDDSGTVAVEVPAAWSQVDGTPRELDDGTTFPSVVAAPDLASFYELWTAPGVEVMAVAPETTTDVAGILDDLGAGAAAECTDAGREEYGDQLYTGLIQFYADCGGGEAAVVLIAAQPPDVEFTAVVIVQLATQADAAVLDRVVQTFIVSV
jgi:serine protease Do